MSDPKHIKLNISPEELMVSASKFIDAVWPRPKIENKNRELVLIKMKTEYQYIHFIKLADKPKTSVWSCRNTKSNFELGRIQWQPRWRQYCFFSVGPAVYSADCLVDIRDFIEQLKSKKIVKEYSFLSIFAPSREE